jgi:hypothetical protein
VHSACIGNRVATILNILLAVQNQSKQRAKKSLDIFSRGGFLDSSLNVLWTVVWQPSGEHFMETRAERDDELRCDNSVSVSHNGPNAS